MRFVLLMAIEAIIGANFDYKFSFALFHSLEKFVSSSSKFVYNIYTWARAKQLIVVLLWWHAMWKERKNTNKRPATKESKPKKDVGREREREKERVLRNRDNKQKKRKMMVSKKKRRKKNKVLAPSATASLHIHKLGYFHVNEIVKLFRRRVDVFFHSFRFFFALLFAFFSRGNKRYE